VGRRGRPHGYKSLNENAGNFVVIEENEKRFEELEQAGILTILGNATHEDILQNAGIRKARGIVCALPTILKCFYCAYRQANE
jgi:Trk K+ transport system NAD-binding subunit